MRQIAQFPYRTVYIAGVDDSLDMDGFIAIFQLRNGNVESHSFYDSRWVIAKHEIGFSVSGGYEIFVYLGEFDSRWAIAKHEIDFSIPGEYEVFFYWGQFPLGSMTIQVVDPN